jgi:hypothetical protein
MERGIEELNVETVLFCEGRAAKWPLKLESRFAFVMHDAALGGLARQGVVPVRGRLAAASVSVRDGAVKAKGERGHEKFDLQTGEALAGADGFTWGQKIGSAVIRWDNEVGRSRKSNSPPPQPT